MTAPYTYEPHFLNEAHAALLCEALWNDLPWLEVTEARREFWMNDFATPYTYGNGVGRRTYEAQPANEAVLGIRQLLRDKLGARLEGCFVNGYTNEKNALGWHADDSPEIDPTQPIAVVSLGAPRAIMFRPKDSKGMKDMMQITLGSGSLLVMEAGMQQTWQHRIPRHPMPCGRRISLTYRSLVRAA